MASDLCQQSPHAETGFVVSLSPMELSTSRTSATALVAGDAGWRMPTSEIDDPLARVGPPAVFFALVDGPRLLQHADRPAPQRPEAVVVSSSSASRSLRLDESFRPSARSVAVSAGQGFAIRGARACPRVPWRLCRTLRRLRGRNIPLRQGRRYAALRPAAAAAASRLCPRTRLPLPSKKRSVGGEPAGYELGEEPNSLCLAGLTLREKPKRAVHVQFGARHSRQ
jgi:hypothetical protein